MRQAFRTAGRFGRARDGATAIEFAIFAGPFFFIIGWILEFGLMQFTEYTLQNAVYEAGRRQIQIGTVMTGTSFRDRVCENAQIILDCNARLGIWVESADNFNDIMVPAIPAGILPASTANFDQGTSGQAVVIIAVIDWNFVFPFMRPLGNLAANPAARRLYGITAFRSE
jgi:Flp pilus assembly protein TadG